MLFMWKHLFNEDEIEYWTRAFNQLGKTRTTQARFNHEVLKRLDCTNEEITAFYKELEE